MNLFSKFQTAKSRWFVGAAFSFAILVVALASLAGAFVDGNDGGCDDGSDQAAADGAAVGSADDPSCVTGNMGFETGAAQCSELGTGHLWIGTSNSSAGLSNSDISVSSNGTYLNVAGSGATVRWSMVKAGPNHNIYGTDRVGLPFCAGEAGC